MNIDPLLDACQDVYDLTTLIHQHVVGTEHEEEFMNRMRQFEQTLRQWEGQRKGEPYFSHVGH